MFWYLPENDKKSKLKHKLQSPGRELNPRPRDYKSRALPD